MKVSFNAPLTIPVSEAVVGEVYLYFSRVYPEQRGVAVMRAHTCNDREELKTFFVLENGQGLSQGTLLRLSPGLRVAPVSDAELVIKE